jgi:hypothetical protein
MRQGASPLPVVRLFEAEWRSYADQVLTGLTQRTDELIWQRRTFFAGALAMALLMTKHANGKESLVGITYALQDFLDQEVQDELVKRQSRK